MGPEEAQRCYEEILEVFDDIEMIPDPYTRAIQHKMVSEGLVGRALTLEQAADEVAQDQARDDEFGEWLESLPEGDQSVAMALRFALMTYGPNHPHVKNLEAQLRHEQVVEPSSSTAPAPPVSEPPLPMLEGPKLREAAWKQLGRTRCDR
jgi:hypothetical protein